LSPPAHPPDCWIWRPYVAGQGFAYAYVVDGFGKGFYRFVVIGEPAPEPFPKITIGRFSEGPIPDALGGPFGCMIVRPNLRELMERECGDGIQLVPVKVRGPTKEPYVIVNVLARVSCLDEERSRLERDPDSPEMIQRVTKLALRPISEDAPEAFHLAELPSVLLVRSRLRARMEDVSRSPGLFRSVDEFVL
jgi:hypothetical protein